MTQWKRMLLLGLCLSGVPFCSGGTVYGSEKVKLKLAFPEGRTARYKHSYNYEFTSSRAELIVRGGKHDVENVMVRIDGEWRSQETSYLKDGAPKIRATIEKTASRVMLNSRLITYNQFPYTLEWLKGWEFSWLMTPDHQGRDFSIEATASGPPQIELVTEFFQLWLPELCPALPEAPVGVGDTWEGERRFEVPYKSMRMMGRKALVDLKSKYKVKKIKEKKGRTEVVIEEKRKVRYQGWLNIVSLSIFIDGEGKGSGEWEIDVTRGIVLSHKGKINVFQPEITKSGEKRPVPNTGAEIQIRLRRKLDKLIKEKG